MHFALRLTALGATLPQVVEVDVLGRGLGLRLPPFGISLDPFVRLIHFGLGFTVLGASLRRCRNSRQPSTNTTKRGAYAMLHYAAG